LFFENKYWRLRNINPSDGGVLELSHSDKAKDSAERKDNGSVETDVAVGLSVVVDCWLLVFLAARTSRDRWRFLIIVVLGANVNEGCTQATVVVGRRVKLPTMIRAAAFIIVVVDRIGMARCMVA
jgi:hypothetical protein